MALTPHSRSNEEAHATTASLCRQVDRLLAANEQLIGLIHRPMPPLYTDHITTHSVTRSTELREYEHSVNIQDITLEVESKLLTDSHVALTGIEKTTVADTPTYSFEEMLYKTRELHLLRKRSR